jgi:hypothetical protein
MSNDTNTWKPLGWLWVLFYKTFYACNFDRGIVRSLFTIVKIFSGCCSIKHFTLVTVTVEL